MINKLLSGQASPIAFFKDAVGRFIKTPLRSTKDGALFVVDWALDFGPIYDDGTYQYFGEALPSTPRPLLTASVWRVSRIDKVTGREEWVDSGNFTQVFTDLATVQGLF